jgi:hypothetical protein
MARVEVTVPAGVAAGEMLEFDHEGVLQSVVVPDGLAEGDIFEVELGPGGAAAKPAELTGYLQERAASGDLMDRFVHWFENNEIEEQFETWIADHAHLVQGAGSGSEQSHEWWPVYLEYQTKFEGLLEQFLVEAGVSAEEFLTAAKSASGMNDIILKIFLASSEYETFVNFMADRQYGSDF